MPKTGPDGRRLKRPAFTIDADVPPQRVVAALEAVLRARKYRITTDGTTLRARGASNLKSFLNDSLGVEAIPALKSWGQTAVIDVVGAAGPAGSRTRVEFRAADIVREVPRLLAAFDEACAALQAQGVALTRSAFAESTDVPAPRA